MTEEPLVTVRRVDRRRDVEECALVLVAIGLAPVVRREEGAFSLCVPERERARAEVALGEYEAEVRAAPPPPEPAVLYPGTGAAIAVSLGLMLFHMVTGPRNAADAWFALGGADSARILAGEVWRTVTALTLHADGGHVLGNAIAGALFLSAVFRWVGIGVGGWLVLLAGALGNAVNALVQGPGHRSVGASTAVFGAVGVLGALALARRGRGGVTGRRRWAPVAAGLAIIAMLGTGPRADFGAHLFGFAAGVVVALPVAFGLRQRTGDALQWGLAAAALLAIAAAWAVAIA